MAPKVDIGWDHATPFNGEKQKPQCNYCGKVIHAGITRLKFHLAHKGNNVSGCKQVSRELMVMMQKHIAASEAARATEKRRKDEVRDSLRDDVRYGYGATQYHGNPDDDGTNPLFQGMSSIEIAQLKLGMNESRTQFSMDEYSRRHSFSHGGSSSTLGVSGFGAPHDHAFERRDTEDEIQRMDPYAFSSRSSKQKKISDFNFKENVKKVGRAISKFMLFNAIPFHTADNGPFYQVMIDTIAEFGRGVKGPSRRQLGNEYLKLEVEDLSKFIANLKTKWPEYGCTIMCDGWSSRNKHPIINFMVYCNDDMIFLKSFDTTNKSKTAKYIYSLMKEVVLDVGEKNIVQIVTDNETSYKVAGRKLMEKFKHLFWSSCSAHCIDLILEDIGDAPAIKSVIQNARKIISFIYNSDQLVNYMREYTGGRELLRPGITRFATEFIALESLVRYKQELKRLFLSDEWRELSYVKRNARIESSKQVYDLITTDQFWKGAEMVIKAMEPLVHILKLMDQEKKPTMPIVYDAIDRAKLAIKNSKIKGWKQYWEIIDKRWDTQLHCHLHAAGYFLNPICQYSPNYSNHDEVRLGIKQVIQRLEPNLDIQAKALTEVHVFKEREGSFGSSLAHASISQMSLVNWWYHHGESAPNLRQIALKVLSQTSSSSGCERNWSTFSLIHTKIRNKLAMKKLEQLVFVHYNLRLRVRTMSRKHSDDNEYCPIDLNHIFDDEDSLDPWITELEEPLLDGQSTEWVEAGVRVFSTPQGQRQQQLPTDLNVVSSSTTSGGSGNDTGSGSNDGGDTGNDRVGVEHGSQDSSHVAGMTWAEGYSNFYATQDTDHGYRPARDPSPGINARRQHLDRLRDIPSQTPSNQHSTGMGGLHRSFSTGRYGSYVLPTFNHPPPTSSMPQPPQRWSQRSTSTNVSSGGTSNRRRGSGSSSSRDGGRSTDLSYFGPTGHGYHHHGSTSETLSAPSVGMEIDTSEGGESSQSQLQYGSDFTKSLFPYPQVQFYGQPQPTYEDGFEPPRHSWWG